MKVSLCGPHSFETSTLLPTVKDDVVSGEASPPLSRMNSYLLHQVGSFELLCADTLDGRVEMLRLNANSVKRPKTTRRILLFITIFSPWQMCWSDRSQNFGPRFYRKRSLATILECGGLTPL